MPKITLLTKWKLLQAINADPRVTPMGVKVAVAMLDNRNTVTGRCDPSAGSIALRTARCERMVSTGRQNLIDTGWLRYRRRQRTWAYEFAFDRRSDPQDVADHKRSDPQDPAPQDPADKTGKYTNREDSKPGRESDNQMSDSLSQQSQTQDQRLEHARGSKAARWNPSEAGIDYARNVIGFTDSEIEKLIHAFRMNGQADDDAWCSWCDNKLLDVISQRPA